jgi:hypothetical protein
VSSPWSDEQAPWSDHLSLAEENGPQGFTVAWRFDAQPIFGVSGSRTACTEYLISNYSVAARAFAHDAGVLHYAPFRVTIHEAPDGQTVFSIDRPSDPFSTFGRAEITEVGREFDRKAGALLRHLGVAVPDELT